MLNGIHFLLTYECNYECDHCFLYCGPFAAGTFTSEQIKQVFDEIDKIGHITNVYFEGGEPFIFYPLMLHGMKMAKERNLDIGIVTNAYWAQTVEDAELWLAPIAEMKISDLSLSDDELHQGDKEDSPPKRASRAAKKLGIPVGSICIEKPSVDHDSSEAQEKGAPIIGGDVCFRGRAADKLSEGLPTRKAETFNACNREELADPGRVHIDAYGNVQVCQGISIGNMWQTPLSEIVANYDAAQHPICGPLLEGGPHGLARKYDVSVGDNFVDECHYCFLVRRKLLDKFPEFLAPRQVYGLD